MRSNVRKKLLLTSSIIIAFIFFSVFYTIAYTDTLNGGASSNLEIIAKYITRFVCFPLKLLNMARVKRVNGVIIVLNYLVVSIVFSYLVLKLVDLVSRKR
jgi:hypothetical protein